MSIYLRTGNPGHGKSYGAIRVIRDALDRGEWVATNIVLREGWAETMARTNLFRRMVPGRVAKTAASYEARMHVSHDLGEFSRLRLPECGKCSGCVRHGKCHKEGRGRLVLDEAHNWLNSRTWDADESGQGRTKAQAVQARMDIVRLFSQHRKLGWHVDLITQDELNLDRQVRGLFEYHVHLKNLRRYRALGIFPVVPCNVFVAVTTWHDNEKSKLGVETFLLNKKLAGCYDTTATSHGLDYHAPDAIWLGRPAGERTDGREPAQAGARPAARRPPARPAQVTPGRGEPSPRAGGVDEPTEGLEGESRDVEDAEAAKEGAGV